MSTYCVIEERFGRPSVDVFNENSYRVILWDWHVHQGASHGQLSGYGRSIEEASKRLLATANKPSSLVVMGSCNDRCYDRYQATTSAKLAGEELWKFLNGLVVKSEAPAWHEVLMGDD